MIIQNGTIEVQASTGGGLDPTTGYPTPATITWGDPIPCQYIPSKYDSLARTNGEAVTQRGYTILIEPMTFTASRIRLKDIDGTTIGEFSIISIETLYAVGETKILV